MATLEELSLLGLTEQKAKETFKNANLRNVLKVIITEAEKVNGSVKDVGVLLYHLGSKIKPQVMPVVPLLVEKIMKKELNNTLRVDAALEFCLTHAQSQVDPKELDKACGVGVEVTSTDIREAVKKGIDLCKVEIMEKRYRFNTGLLMQSIRENLRWADGKDVKTEVDAQIEALLGPKTLEDTQPVKKEKVKKEPKKKEGTPTPKESSTNGQPSDTTGEDEVTTIAEMLAKVNFHKPGENHKTDGYVLTSKTKELLASHLKETGGQVRTRFPPEPNGILHIGHAKAININFGYAALKGGVCFLRYDDTNPEKEEEKFFIGIRDMVEFLGYTPFKVTHSSDYFDQLFKWAVQLIQKGLAYVCHQTADEMKGFNPPPSPWRDRPIEESLTLFEDMRKGKIDEGKATLRMKVMLEEGKADPVAYRIKFLPHPRTGDKWCIYPTYDFTHCLCDSIEHITHSLCTKEFQSRRSSYYWLCNALDIYCPVQWEYGRLNVNYTVVSKRKIAKLIDTEVVSDWDDPRLFTLTALRRRGFPAEAINMFCAKMGVTGAVSSVDPSSLEACVRDVLNRTAPRTMVVLEPLKVVIVEGGPQDGLLTVPDFPTEPDQGSHSISLGSVIYIEQSDFRVKPESGYRRLTPGQSVGLKHAGLVLFLVDTVMRKEDPNIIDHLNVRAEPLTTQNKPKAFIHWVSRPISIRVRLYSPLFKHKNPEDVKEVPDGFLSDINSNSMEEHLSLADAYLSQAKPLDKYQFERLGFFTLDPRDSAPPKVLIFNRTVSLKEDAGKV